MFGICCLILDFVTLLYTIMARSALNIVFVAAMLLVGANCQCHFGNETRRLFCTKINHPQFLAVVSKLESDVDSLYLFKTTMDRLDINAMSNDHLKTMKHLQLDGNPMWLFVDDIFNGFESLESFVMTDNSPAWNIKIGTFRGASSLRTIQIDHTGLSSIEPGSFFDLNSLVSVEIRNSLCTTVLPSTFMGLDGTNSLKFEASKLNSLPAGAFFGLSGLKELSLSYNDITELKSNLFKGLMSVKTLNLSKNPIDKLNYAAFSGLISVETLDLTMTGVTDVDWVQLKRYMPKLINVLLTTY